MIVKRIAGVAFAVAFLMAIVLFTGYGRNYISPRNAQMVFLVSGAIALFLNLLTFRAGKHSTLFSFFFWLGAIVLFVGLLFQYMHWPYHRMIVFSGLGITGISFFLKDEFVTPKDDSELLDDPKNQS